MANDDDVLQPGGLDVANQRFDEISDRHLPQVSGLASPARHVGG